MEDDKPNYCMMLYMLSYQYSPIRIWKTVIREESILEKFVRAVIWFSGISLSKGLSEL